MKKYKYAVIGIIILVVIAALLSIKKDDTNINNDTKLKIATINGPTGYSMAGLYDDPRYEFIMCATPDEIVGKIISTEIDIASIPTNLASTLYNRTGGEIKLLSVNALGNLYVVSTRDDIKSLDDLSGKQVAMSGKGATPEVIVSKLCENLKLDIQFKAEHSEVASLLVAGKVDTVILPEPFVTNVMSQLETAQIAINLSKTWEEKYSSELPMGCVIISKEFSQNEKQVKNFLENYEKSINLINNEPQKAAELIVNANVAQKVEVVEKSIPRCNITMLTKDAMKDCVKQYLEIIKNFNPQMIGGKVPNEEFYY